MDVDHRAALDYSAPTAHFAQSLFPTFTTGLAMPLPLSAGAPTILIRKEAFERTGLARSTLDRWLNLTDEEFRVEGALIAVGPLYGDETLTDLIAELESAGLVYFDDFFETSGNWPEWLRLLAMGSARGD